MNLDNGGSVLFPSGARGISTSFRARATGSGDQRIPADYLASSAQAEFTATNQLPHADYCNVGVAHIGRMLR